MDPRNVHPLRLALAAMIAVTSLFSGLTAVNASRSANISDDGNVVFGAQVDIWGDRIGQSVDLAVDMQMDWLLVEYNWTRIWPREGSAPATRQLSTFMDLAAEHDIQVLLSLTNAPAWAQDDHGPDAIKTAALVSQLLSEHPAIGAIELFPGANTQAGWGTDPNAAAYLALFDVVQHTLQSNDDVLLLAGGFSPASQQDDIEEAHFLDALYEAGALGTIEQFSLRFPTGSAQPGEAQDGLARYERLRLVMMRHEDDAARVWVTAFSWPTTFSSTQQEHIWLFQSYHAMQSQLYIEAAFFNTLNPPSLFSGWQSDSLIARNGSVHDALQFFHDASLQQSNFAASLAKDLNEVAP